MIRFIYFYFLLGFQYVVLTPSGSYGDIQLLLEEEVPKWTNIRILTCLRRTTLKNLVMTGTRTHAMRRLVVKSQQPLPLSHG